MTVSVQAADTCLTADCHGGIEQAEYQHAPVAAGDCGDCHAAAGADHPGSESMRLNEPEPALCLQCHEDPAAGQAHVHSAVTEGCTDCHHPHGGEYAAFVQRPGGELCLVCHEQILAEQAQHVQGETFFTANSGGLELLQFGVFPEDERTWPADPGNDLKHGPAAAGSCLMCHSVHGGENRAMMKLPGNRVCLACHTGIKTIIAEAKSQHEPVAKGNCWDCHTAHASDFEPLLRAYYPREFYAPYEEENFALCFNCHSKEAFQYQRTSEATGFRNGDRNLHYFHVNRPDKGRVCKSCHGVHGAAQANLLQRKVDGFGDWDIPLVWANAGERATCYVGCHRPKTYDRTQLIPNR